VGHWEEARKELENRARLNGPDPGLIQGVETEADLDVEWSGAVATGAAINLVVSASTNGVSGVRSLLLYMLSRIKLRR